MNTPETKASERLVREAFTPVYNEYGFRESYANAYPAHCNQSFAYEIFEKGFQAGRSHPAPGVMEDEAVEAMCNAYDAEVDYLGDSAMEHYCNDVPMRAAYRALAKNTPVGDKVSPCEMLADIMNVKETLKIYANPDLFERSHYPQGYIEAAKALAALEKYGDKHD